MKIMLLTTHLRPGGISVYTASLARHLLRNGIKVLVVSSGGELAERAEERFPHVKLDINTKCEFGFKVFKNLPALLRICKKENIDLIHAQTRVTQVLGRMASRIAGMPMVTTAHGFYGYKRLSRRFFPCWGDGVIAISKGVEEHLLTDFGISPERVAQIYNGIELEKFLEAPREIKDLKHKLGLPEQCVIIGSVGRLSEVKGYRYLIDACAGIKEKGKDIFLLLVGEGKRAEALRRQAEKSAIKDCFLMTSPRAEIEKYFFAMDIFVLPSLQEGLGLSLMEAMAAGRACVASRVGGLSELITEGRTGLLAEPGCGESLGRAVGALATDERLRRIMGLAAREKALGEFSIEKSVSGTSDFYRRILQRTGDRNAGK